jgi:hypothetical protein
LTSYERKNRLQVSLCYWCVQSNVWNNWTFSRNLVDELVRWKAPLWRISCFLEWRKNNLWGPGFNSATPLRVIKWFMAVYDGKFRNF